jgi:mannose-6-phosphate isomerase class I
MDFWVEAIDPHQLKLLPADSYREIIKTLLCYPIKEIKIYQPCPWGAYRYKDLFDVPGLECNAWNELAGPELGVIVDLGECRRFEMPVLSLMQYQSELLGPYLTEAYPRLFPMDVWLDDGYFPQKTPLERTAMPIHNHPSTDYVKSHFNEPLGRYETYYICEAYEGACSIMGFKDGADLEEWEKKCRKSENLTEIADWKDYCCIWDSNIGDLFLIPPGTVHAHGGNQMVLEMDTCPSVAATEYSFFEYDFARNSWDDEKKAMTAKPMKMHLEHGFDNEKWRRESWVKDHLLAKPKVEKWTKDYKRDRYSSVPEMPFEIERFHFYTKAVNDTMGKFAHIITLTIGKRVLIRSLSDPGLFSDIVLFQSAIVPASFGGYEIISEGGGFCEVVQMRWKKG